MVRDAAKYLFYQIQLKLTWVHRWPRIGPKPSSGPGAEQGHGTWKRTRNTDKDTEQEHGSGAGAKAELMLKLTLHMGERGVLLCPRVCVCQYMCVCSPSKRRLQRTVCNPTDHHDLAESNF